MVSHYDNCAYAEKERAPLATNPRDPNLAMCASTNGKGLIAFDLRKAYPAQFLFSLHSTVIKDIIYLDETWPFGHHSTIVSVSSDGVCKIRTLDDKHIHSIDVLHRSNCLTATPDTYLMSEDYGLRSLLMIGGDKFSGYMPGPDSKLIDFGPSEIPIQRLKYTSNGHLLYTASSKGQVARLRRVGDELKFVNNVYSHKDEIIDMDISPTDEYLVTSSRDGTVGLLCLGVPSYGWTGFMELA